MCGESNAANIKTVDVVVKHAIDPEEVTVAVPEKSQLMAVKEILSEQISRPEVLKAEMLKSLPDGTFIVMKDTMWLGSRRLFHIRGTPLYPPPPPRPPATVEDMDEFDPEERITSPRSIRACALEGVAAEDLIYVPIEAYRENPEGPVSPRIADLWHDFFEALRQDHLEAVRTTRRVLIGQDEEEADLSSGCSSPMAYPVGLPIESIASGNAGRWAGSLEQSRYSRVHEFFREQVEMSKEAQLFKNASPSFRKGQTDRYGGSSTVKRSAEDIDPILTGDTAEQAAEKLHNMLSDLKRTPGYEKYVEEQRLKTEAEGIVQRREKDKKLHKEQEEARRLVERRVETADYQVAIKDGEIQYTHSLRRGLDKRATAAAVANRPNPTKLEEKNRAAAQERAEHVARRREIVHENQLDYEQWRNEQLERHLLEEQATTERVHQMRQVAGLKVAKEWVNKRIRWTKNYANVGRGIAEFNAATMAKYDAAQTRIDTQKVLKQKWIEYRRELQNLRRMYAELAQHREQAKTEARRDAISTELHRMSKECRSLGDARSEPLSPALSSPTRKLDRTLCSSGASSPSSPSVSGARSRRALKQPRFDFPRVGAATLAVTDASPTSRSTTLRSSSSAPNLGGGLGRTEQLSLAA